jgi:hypothetical protein
MLGFSMITLSLLILGIFALFFFAVVMTSLQYEQAKRADRKPKQQQRRRLSSADEGELASVGK